MWIPSNSLVFLSILRYLCHSTLSIGIIWCQFGEVIRLLFTHFPLSIITNVFSNLMRIVLANESTHIFRSSTFNTWWFRVPFRFPRSDHVLFDYSSAPKIAHCFWNYCYKSLLSCINNYEHSSRRPLSDNYKIKKKHKQNIKNLSKWSGKNLTLGNEKSSPGNSARGSIGSLSLGT